VPRPKPFFVLHNEAYGQAAPDGNLVLVVNDPPLYWLVTLLMLKQTDWVHLRKHSGSCFGSGRNGTCRFLSLNRAEAHFEAMTRVPERAAEIDKAQKVKELIPLTINEHSLFKLNGKLNKKVNPL
jgi:hypothetical protein